MPTTTQRCALRSQILHLCLMTCALSAFAAACDEEATSPAPCDPAPGRICTIAGTGISGLSADGAPPLETDLYLPQDLTLNPSGVLHLVDWNNHRIRAIIDGKVKTLVGTGYLGDAANGVGLQVNLNHPTNLTFRPNGEMIIAAWHNSKILTYNPQTEMVEAICGTGGRSFNGDGKPALETVLDLPSAVALAPDGSIYFSDQANQRVRRIKDDGTIESVVGNGEQGFGGDGGPSIEAKLFLPTSQSAPPAGRITTNTSGDIYIADTGNHVIRLASTDGTIRTIAGTGSAGTGADGAATSAALNTPSDVAVDAAGNVFVADTMNHCIRRISPDGQMTTAAGICGKRGFSGDGGSATAALLDRPYGVEVGPDGILYIADTHNHVFRAVYP
jgi:sugar lactone lactonase YvrE